MPEAPLAARSRRAHGSRGPAGVAPRRPHRWYQRSPTDLLGCGPHYIDITFSAVPRSRRSGETYRLSRALGPDRPRKWRQIRLHPAGPRLGRGQDRRAVVPGEQALVQQRRITLGERIEVGDRRVGSYVITDDLGPRTGDRRVELLRRVRGELPDPVADHAGRPRRPVAAGDDERQVHVLAVPEPLVRRDDLVQDLGELGGDRMGHLGTSVRARVTARNPARSASLTPARAACSRSA